MNIVNIVLWSLYAIVVIGVILFVLSLFLAIAGWLIGAFGLFFGLIILFAIFG